MLPVNEIFTTLQGEGHWTGTPATFIRLQGCDVGCPWCDTKHTWELNPENETTLDAIIAKVDPSPTFALASVDQLVDIVINNQEQHVVITGGEPCAFDLTEMTARITRRTLRQVQIETSGTYEVKAHHSTWLTVSPKVGMPGRKAVRDDALRRANELKMPVGKPDDIETLQRLIQEAPQAEVWLQPLSGSPKATKLCMEAARQHGWRVSIQVHKLIGLR